MMLFKTKILKNISILLIILFSIAINAQKNKIDGVAVVVGKNVVLNSDIEKFKKEVELRSYIQCKEYYIHSCLVLRQ